MNECILCAEKLEIILEDNNLHGVTSDWRVTSLCGIIAICLSCGHVQKIMTPEWKSEVTHIYQTYKPYPIQGGSPDQLLFSNAGVPKSRFAVLLERLMQHISLSKNGRLLDIGCAKGVFLSEIQNILPDWELYGHEYDEHFKENILQIPNVRGFTSGKLNNINEKFDLISLQHVLEHLFEPQKDIVHHLNLMNEKSLHFIQVPCFFNDPFDLMVTEHCSHFTSLTLKKLAKQSGLKILNTTEGWTPKHHGWLACKEINENTNKCIAKVACDDVQNIREHTLNALEWIKNIPEFVRKKCRNKKLGVFGTAQAGTWTAEALKGDVSFFVDEDKTHQGKEHLGLPIVAPQDIPVNSKVFLAFAPKVAKSIKLRLDKMYNFDSFFYAP